MGTDTDKGMASTELSAVLVDKHLPGLPDRFQPRNLTELMSWAKLVTGSGLAPKGMNEAGVVLCVQMGAELNVTPTQAIQNIAVINGRPSLWGDLGLALFRRDASFRSFEERDPAEAAKCGEGCCKIVMNDGRQIVRTFSREDAKKAKLYERSGATGPWNTYEGRMLMFRARWWAMRDAEPGVFKGLAGREEQEDIRDISGEVRVDGIPLPRRASEANAPTTQEIDSFLKDQKAAPAAPGAAPVDRASLQKVLVKSGTEKKSGSGTAFYVICLETANGAALEITTFDEAHYRTAGALKGKFALVATKKNTGKDGKTYTNLTHIEAEAAAEQEPETPPVADEPGGNG